VTRLRRALRVLVALAALGYMVCFESAASPVAAQDASGKPTSRETREASGRKAKARRADARKNKNKREEHAAPSGPSGKPEEGAAPSGKPEEQVIVREQSANDAEAERKSQAARDAAADASSDDVRKEGDTEIKVMEFSGLDIEGQLKTPQMLYFLNRLRAEFGRPDLPHRSFIPELQRATKEKAF
jgi:hypothetical protein